MGFDARISIFWKQHPKSVMHETHFITLLVFLSSSCSILPPFIRRVRSELLERSWRFGPSDSAIGMRLWLVRLVGLNRIGPLLSPAIGFPTKFAWFRFWNDSSARIDWPKQCLCLSISPTPLTQLILFQMLDDKGYIKGCPRTSVILWLFVPAYSHSTSLPHICMKTRNT